MARLTRWRSVPVNDRERPYEAHIGAGTAGLLEEYAADADRVAVIHTASTEPHAREIAAPLIDAKHVVTLEIPDAEQGKDLSVLAQCWEALGEETFTRTDLVVGVGGGAVTDLAGFAAATWLRGIDVVHVPTSLLGAVDASVGGKTGINTAAGKNLVGAFHTPRAVLCDTRYLRTLPEREAAGGLAEIVKAGFIADPGILELIENDPRAALDPSGDLVPELMARAIAVKAEVVGEDLKETGKRAFLNFGHTLAHAIEKHEDYRMRHGEAVAIGMVYAAELGRLTGRADLVARVEAILESVGLPTRYSGADWDSLHGTMLVDKKNRGATQRFVLLDALAEPAVVSDVPVEAQREAFARVREGEAPE
ncbi:3-dehydroquinate synthase [Salininema proteolyticum]|uniref:3-dehydroquinate synthase n=1 Tax=Salininema proteolyticum TaxID=1607685 RepID=A0ABV8TZG2_9ACTN